MHPALQLALAAPLLAAGYILGRLRPLDRLDTWVWRRLTFGGRWTLTRRGQLAVLAAHALVRPAATVQAWRHRHDPPPCRAAAPTVHTVHPEETDR